MMPASLEGYYKILELNIDASKEDIKRAYRRLALKYHPDKNRGAEDWASKIFTKVNEAYSILIDNAHIGEPINNIDDAILFFRRHFYDLARRIDSEDCVSDKIYQEECDYFFRYQLGEVKSVQRSSMEARRIISLMKKAISKGYDTACIIKDHTEFFQKFGYEDSGFNGYDDLIADYKKTIEKEPNNPLPHFALGLIYERQNKINEAISEYRIALSINPNHYRAKQCLNRLTKRSREIYYEKEQNWQN
jgi:curved DNA-binding protein CbpA